jgi:hypothetical protein
MSTENEAAIKVIVELQAKPGRGPSLRVCSKALWRNMDRAAWFPGQHALRGAR